MSTRSSVSSSSAARRLLRILAASAALSTAADLAAQSTWAGLGSDANWSTSGNWSPALANSFSTGLVFAGSTQLANTNDLTGGTATSITFNSGAGTFTVGGNAITLGGGIANNSTSLQTLNLDLATTAVRTVTLTTGGGNVTLGGIVSGTGGGLTTAGAGTLTLNGANTYTGATTVGAATTLKVGNAGALGAATGALTLSSGGTLDLNGLGVTKGNFSANTATATVTSSTAASLTINFQNTAGLYSGLSLTGAASLLINGSSGNNNPLGTGTIVAGTGSIGYQNQTGAIRMNNVATNLGANGTLLFNGTGRIATTTNNITVGAGNAIVVNGTGNSWDFQPTSNGNITTNGQWTGSGTITLTQGFQTPTFNFTGNMTGFTGTLVLASSGTTSNQGVQYAFRNSTAGQIGAGSAVITQQLNQGSTLNNTIQWKGTGSQTIPLGDLNTNGSLAYTAAGVNALSNAIAATTATFQVGALGNSSTYAGNIVNGAGTVAITKVGSGTWTLTGASTYTGATAVDAGTLALGSAGSLAGASAFSVAAGATFDVSAKSSYALGAGGLTLSVGASNAGYFNAGSVPLTLGNGLTLGFTSATPAASYNLLDFGSQSGDFSSVTLTGSFSGSLVLSSTDTWTGSVGGYNFTFTETDGILAVSAIPEPSTCAALAGLGMLALAVRRRRAA